MKKAKNQEVEKEIMEEINPDLNDKTANMSEAEEQNPAIEAAEWQDRFLRLSAEFDNYRKRTLKEKMELLEHGGADIIKLILPTADDLDRALASMQEGTDREGVSLIYQNFMDALCSKGLAEIEAKGAQFDVDYHEAVAKMPASDDFPAGIVVDVVQKGYLFKDKVVRFAKVVVAE